MTAAVACMGGWCGKRAHCRHYLAEDRAEPAERLCEPGRDGVGREFAIVRWTPVGQWERNGSTALLARPSPMEIAA